MNKAKSRKRQLSQVIVALMSGEFIGIGLEVEKNLALGGRHGDLSSLILTLYHSNSYCEVSHSGRGLKIIVSF